MASASSSFYIVLPSNSSMEHFPENHAGHYFTRLPQPIDLDSDYEVGLSEILFTDTYYNIKEGHKYWLQLRTTEESDDIQVDAPPGQYSSAAQFIGAINKALKKVAIEKSQPPDNVDISYDNITKKVTLEFKEEGSGILLSPVLQKLLHFKQNVMYGKGIYTSTRVVTLNKDFQAVYVYTDLAEFRPVGDVMAPLLRIIPLVQSTSSDIIHHIFEKPQYIPVSRRRFETVEILLSTDTGETISFGEGKTLITVHFRRRQPRF